MRLARLLFCRLLLKVARAGVGGGVDDG